MFARRIAKELQSLISVSVPFPLGLNTRGRDVAVAVFPVRYGRDWSENCNLHQHSDRQFRAPSSSKKPEFEARKKKQRTKPAGVQALDCMAAYRCSYLSVPTLRQAT